MDVMKSQSSNAHHGPIPFPVEAARMLNAHSQWLETARRSMHQIMRDRRMYVLARQLDCLGHFDSDPDGPCAA